MDHSAVSWRFFALGGRLLTNPGPGGGLDVYARHPALQIGPLPLVAAAVLNALGPLSRIAAVAVLTVAGFVMLGVIGQMRIGGVRLSRRRLFVLALLFMPVWMELAFHYAHLDDGLALLAATVAMREAGRGRAVSTALALALAADCKPWAVAFVPLLFVVAPRDRMRAFAVWASGVAVAWVPFVVADWHTLLAATFRIPNTATSALRALGVTAGATPAWDRPAELVFGTLLAALAVRTGRWPAAPFAAVCVRILLDPGTYAYYTAGLVITAVLVDAFLTRLRAPVYTAGAVVAVYLLRAVPVDAAALGALRATYCLLALTALFLLTPRMQTSRLSVSDEARTRDAVTYPTMRKAS